MCIMFDISIYMIGNLCLYNKRQMSYYKKKYHFSEYQTKDLFIKAFKEMSMYIQV